jgi:hypothetical protein
MKSEIYVLCPPTIFSSLVSSKMYKRPALRTKPYGWSEPKRLSSEDLQRILRPSPVRPRPERQWTPSLDYEIIARHMPAEEGAAYIKRSETWFAECPPRPVAPPPRRENIDQEMVATLIARYGSAVPLADYARAGYSEEALERIRARRQWFKDHDEELTAEIERRWPGSAKAKPKVKKVIKAVKKKMT